MRVQVAGRHVELGQALQSRINDDLERTIEKYFPRSGEATVTVAREGIGFEVDCSVHLPSGIVLQAEGSGGDAHGAFENALEKMEKRVRRYKRRLKNHHNTQKDPLPAEAATAYVLKSDQDHPDADESEAAAGESPDGAPLVIAETAVSVKTMTVSMAVLQLDLADSPALLFRNAANGGLNLVYRRPDGNVGWIDPQRADGKDHGVERLNGSAR
jgi:ribosomal subunit interface protein